MTDFELSNANWILRCINRSDFLDYWKSKINERKNDVAVLLIWCNSHKNIMKCITYLNQETNQNFDIIIVDNSTRNEEIKLIHDMWSNERISVLKTTDNIWGSGWYCVWMEYIISKWYESLICFEDDVIPIDKDVISETIRLLREHDIVGSFVEWEDTFWMFHIRWYSVKLLLGKIWVVDPRFFLSRDDADFQYRFMKLGLRDLRVNTGKQCFHPSYKKNREWVICFVQRNHLFYIQKHPMVIHHWLYLFINLFINILFWFSYYFITNQYEVTSATFYWIYSFLFQKIWKQSNNKILRKFKRPNKHPENVVPFVWNLGEANDLLKNRYNLYKKVTWNIKLLNELVISDNYQDSKNWIVISWYISWRFAMRYETIFCIDEYKYEDGKYYISIIDNKLKFRYLKMLFSFIITGIVIVPIVASIVLKVFIANTYEKFKHKNVDK